MSSVPLSDSSHPIHSYDPSFVQQSRSKFDVTRALLVDYFRENGTDVDQKEKEKSSVWRVEQQSSSSGITVWSRTGLGDSTDPNLNGTGNENGIRLLRTTVSINSSADTVFATLKDPEQLLKWHPSIDLAQPIYHLDDSCRLSYLTLKPQMGGIISARHSVEVVRYGRCQVQNKSTNQSETQDCCILASSSIPAEIDQDPANGLPSSTNENKKKVRSVCYLNAYAVIPIGANQCQIVWFIETDIKGWLSPSRALGPMVAKNIETLKSLKAFCEGK